MIQTGILLIHFLMHGVMFNPPLQPAVTALNGMKYELVNVTKKDDQATQYYEKIIYKAERLMLLLLKNMAVLNMNLSGLAICLLVSIILGWKKPIGQRIPDIAMYRLKKCSGISMMI